MRGRDLTLPACAPERGEVFAGRYRITGVLGAGGMGYVLAAEHLLLRELVAIKMLRPEQLTDATRVERFLREGRAAVKIHSDHVARVLDVAELPDGRPYLVMEHLEGADLGTLLEERGPLPIPLAVDYVLAACEALAEAHAMGTVHRDLKPSNLFLARCADGEERVKVLDFGISKLSSLDEDALTLTRTSAILGSPQYMSPEQLKGARDVDARADVWALGVILFELVSGERPFEAETIAELGALVLSGRPPWLAQVAPHVPPDLAAIVATCLRRDRDKRFVDLADFATALGPFGSPDARRSAERIVATLGMPSVRATPWSAKTSASSEPPTEDAGGALSSSDSTPVSDDPPSLTTHTSGAPALARQNATRLPLTTGLVVVAALVGVAVGARGFRRETAKADARPSASSPAPIATPLAASNVAASPRPVVLPSGAPPPPVVSATTVRARPSPAGKPRAPTSVPPASAASVDGAPRSATVTTGAVAESEIATDPQN